MNGTGDPYCLGWTGRVCAAACALGHDITYYNLGIRRDTSADVRRRWYEEALRRLPVGSNGCLVFSFGINDTVIEGQGQRVSLEESLDNLQQILTLAKARYPTLMVGPSLNADVAHNERIHHLSQHYHKWASQMGVPYLDISRALNNHNEWLPEVMEHDGYHPGAAGYVILAELVQSWHAWRAWF